MNDYSGWTIRYGFLDGNLGNEEAVSHASDYAACVQEAIEAEFPGAKVEVPFQKNTSGSLPCGLNILVIDTDGNEVRNQEKRISRIAEEVFSSGVWLE